MTRRSGLLLLSLLLLGISGLNVLRSCRAGRGADEETVERRARCAACGETFVVPSGYLKTLQADQIITQPNGQKVFTCPRCGERRASALPPPLPPSAQP